jgi:hypothetical protein
MQQACISKEVVQDFALKIWREHTRQGEIYKKFLEELMACFPLIRHVLHRKRRLQQFFVAAGTSLPNCYLATIWGYTDSQAQAPTILLLLLVFIVARTCLPSGRLAIKGGIHFTKPLPESDRRDIHTDTQVDRRDSWSTPLRWAQMPWYSYHT